MSAVIDKSLVSVELDAAPAPAPAPVLLLRKNDNGKPHKDENNVCRILEWDPALAGSLAYNEFAGEIIIKKPIPGTDSADPAYPRKWSDADAVAVQGYVQQLYLPTVGLGIVHNATLLTATRNSFDPLREMLIALVWDGHPRVETLLAEYFNTTKQPPDYLAAVGRSFLVSAVARALKPGCQVDSVPVFEGAQGVGKSSALQILAGDEGFSDSLPHDLSAKDARDHLRGKWIIELPELAQFKRGEIETIKSFLSRRHENYRPAYARNEVTFPRRCVFAGSTNESEYLVDQSGNRRFWPVTVGRIKLDLLARDRDQLLAEAVVMFRNGQAWHLSGEAATIAADQAQSRVAHDPWVSLVADVLVGLQIAQSDVSPGEILQRMDIRPEQRNARSAARVGQALLDLGWLRGLRHRTRGQLYVRPGTGA